MDGARMNVGMGGPLRARDEVDSIAARPETATDAARSRVRVLSELADFAESLAGRLGYAGPTAVAFNTNKAEMPPPLMLSLEHLSDESERLRRALNFIGERL